MDSGDLADPTAPVHLESLSNCCATPNRRVGLEIPPTVLARADEVIE